MSLAALAPSFNCAAKFMTLSGSIWDESKPAFPPWQEVSRAFSVETCAHLCKTGAKHAESQAGNSPNQPLMLITYY
jgi:hypothetical protein